MSVLVVAGFHQSGTSIVTGILTRAGLHVGDDLIGANDSNPYGHFEDREIVRLHDAMLADAGRTWRVDGPFTPTIIPDRWRKMMSIVDRRRAKHRLWGFKDPRVCFFLGAWQYLLPQMRTLIVYRDPRQCSWSLERRHAEDMLRRSGSVKLHRRFWIEPDDALRMWVSHNRALIVFARRNRDRTLVVSHESITTGLQVVPAVRNVLEVPLTDVDNREMFDPRATRHRPVHQRVSDRQVVPEVLDTWRDLEDLAREDFELIQEDTHALRP